MKRTIWVAAAILSFGLASLDAEAQRRMGGGRNLGKQRPAPTMNEAAKAPAPAPATPAPTAAPTKPGTAPAAAGGAAAKPTFMQRWGGLLAGLGIGVLLASLFGEQLGPIIGMLLMALLAIGVVMLLFRLFARKPPPAAYAGATPAPAPGESSPHFRGIGSALTPPATAEDATGVQNRSVMTRNIMPEAIAQSEIAPFLRVARTSFIRLQAAHDARDLDDIRDYTTPELYAEIAMQVGERGDEPQRVEVVNVDAQLLEAIVEGDYAVATVRFTGLIRENNAPNPEPFDELWHVRKSLKDRKAPWLIAGIQQME
jgi:predicted lipid-binding transport protein (Tim44 family)